MAGVCFVEWFVCTCTPVCPSVSENQSQVSVCQFGAWLACCSSGSSSTSISVLVFLSEEQPILFVSPCQCYRQGGSSK